MDLTNLQPGTFTIVYNNGEHRTLRVRKPTAGSNFPQDSLIVGYLAGSENDSDGSYVWFGHSLPKGTAAESTWKFYEGFKIWTSFKAKVKPTEETIMRLRRAVEIIANNGKECGKAYAMKSGRCWRCGRMLTVPSSIESGIGPECATKVG